MISIESITLRNFLSIGAVAQTVFLASVPLTLVLGINLDIGGENNRNGCGKTAMLQAISYALFGKPLTKIKKDNLVNSSNGAQMEVSIVFKRDGVTYRIERGLKPNILRFLVGEDQRDMAQGERQTLLQIERIVGMSHTIFAHIIALNTFTTPFLKMSSADQRDVIEELMGITQISQLAEHLKENLDASKESLRDEEASIKAINDANGRIEQAIGLARNEVVGWDRSHNSLLNNLTDQAAQLSAIDLDAEFTVFDRIDQWLDHARDCDDRRQIILSRIVPLETALDRLQRDLVRYKSESTNHQLSFTAEIRRLQGQRDRLQVSSIASQLARLSAQIMRCRNDASARLDQADKLQTEREVIEGQLRSPDAHSCSVCGQGLSGTDHLATVIAALQTKRDGLSAQRDRMLTEAGSCADDAETSEREVETIEQNHQLEIQQVGQQIELMIKEIDGVRLVSEQEQARADDHLGIVRDDIAELQQQISDQRHDLAIIATGLAEAGESPVSIWESREELWQIRAEREKMANHLATVRAEINPFIVKMDGLMAALLVVSYDNLNNVSDQLKHEQFLYKLLTSKDSFIRKRIIDQNLGYLNRCLNKYLERLGLPHEVIFQPDLTVEIMLLGHDYDFEQLSRGEMNRVILAASFSFRDLWESLNYPINLMALDEILDQGTDGAGVAAAVAIFQEMASQRGRNIFIISHRDELREQIENVLVVQKENNFTDFIRSEG